LLPLDVPPNADLVIAAGFVPADEADVDAVARLANAGVDDAIIGAIAAAAIL
jgi:hypothetical protein